ncbi:hypothetical protein SAMN05880566_10584 [Janthinobacterium sp. TND4EL3]|nr:hypothetical protein SAMN05880566_10584 [Janthinobacterium sp. TND4EL3]
MALHEMRQYERDAARWGDRSTMRGYRFFFVKPADLA